MSTVDIMNSKFKALGPTVVVGCIRRGTVESGTTVLSYTALMTLTLSQWSAFFQTAEQEHDREEFFIS